MRNTQLEPWEGLGQLLRLRYRLSRNALKALFSRNLLRGVSIVCIGGLLWLFFYALFYNGFRFLRQVGPSISGMVEDALFSLFFASMMLMLLFSNAILTISFIHRGEDMPMLFSNPLGHSAVAIFKTASIVPFSSWASLLVVLPFLAAFGILSNAPLFYYLISIPFCVVLILWCAAGGALAGLLLMMLLPRRGGKILVVTVSVAATVSAVYFFSNRIWRLTQDDIYWFFVKALGTLSFLQEPLLPSAWMAQGTMYAARGQAGKSLFMLSAAAGSAAALAALFDIVSNRLLFHAWVSAASAESRRRKRGNLLLRKAESLRTLIVIKDLKILLRDPVQWAQMIILFGLLVLYALNLRTLNYDTAPPFWKKVISFLNLTATNMCLATFTTRFVFPLVSTEGRSLWLLDVSGVSRKMLLSSKYILSFTMTATAGISLTVLSNYMLRTPAGLWLLQAIMTTSVAAGLSGLATGMGAIFPDFKESDPARIVSSFGGTVTLLISLGLVGTISALGLPAIRFESPHALSLTALSSIAVGTAATVIPMRIASTRFAKAEVGN